MDRHGCALCFRSPVSLLNRLLVKDATCLVFARLQHEAVSRAAACTASQDPPFVHVASSVLRTLQVHRVTCASWHVAQGTRQAGHGARRHVADGR